MIRHSYGEAIAAALIVWSQAPPRWGVDDCALALANLDRKVMGIDTARGWRGRYYSAKGAFRVMGRGGVLRMAHRVAKALGWRALAQADLSRAQDGDRGVALTPHGLACVIRYRGFWFGRHHGAGHILATNREIIAAWDIL